ncbi:ArnT family glycosyltransferase [Waltera sp.]|uniref:ArnT family glycosyltransferase n=1 Tax=Waltera sp. TaxID=2815806 RepID=UPI00399EFFF6
MNTMTQDSSTGLWNNKNRKIFFWSILALAVILRCIRFATVPDGINQDEAMGAVDAWALSKYGTDRYGTFLPVHFTAWRYSQMSVLLAYCMVPFIKLFGFNTVTVRLPMVLISFGAVALVYLVGRKLFSERIALVAMLLTAVNPWQFMQSRWSLDCNLFPHIFLAGILFTASWIGKTTLFILVHGLFRTDILLLRYRCLFRNCISFLYSSYGACGSTG